LCLPDDLKRSNQQSLQTRCLRKILLAR
jgi:hypothetical protein